VTGVQTCALPICIKVDTNGHERMKMDRNGQISFKVDTMNMKA